MAERRMFSYKVIESKKFLSLTASAQALYIHLSMVADDEGNVVNADPVRRYCGFKRAALRELEEHGFIVTDDDVTHISHWFINNKLRRCTQRPQTNKDELRTDKDELQRRKERPFDLPNIATNVDNSVQNCTLREEKGREENIIEDNRREGEEKEKAAHPAPPPVTMTEDEYKELCEEFGKSNTDDYIQRCADYCADSGKTYTRYAAKIRRWMQQDGVSKPSSIYAGEELDLEEYKQLINKFD